MATQADAARDRGDWHEPARLYEELLQASPSLHRYRVQLGHAYKELGDFHRANTNYHAVLEVMPEDDDLLLQIGHLEKLKGDRKEAAVYYRNAAQLNEDNTDALVEYYQLVRDLNLPPLPLTEVVDRCKSVESRAPTPVAKGSSDRVSELRSSKRRHRHNGVRRARVLYVSDSLGTPIHPRGIYYYSVALVEILRDLELEITLVVERSPGYGLKHNSPNQSSNLSKESLDCYYSAEIYRCFNESHFAFKWEFENRQLHKIIQNAPLLARIAFRVYDNFSSRDQRVVRNLLNALELNRDKGDHLKMFDQFLYIDRFYSDSMSRAVNDLTPVTLNASGYDLVVIDTPHYVCVKNIDPSRVFSVIHDLIPLNDPFMSVEWRRLFLAKLRTTLSIGGNLIFVSEYTRSFFKNVFPTYAPSREIVLHPSIPKDWIERATDPRRTETSDYLIAISPQRAVQRREHIEERAKRLAGEPEARATLVEELESSLASWDGSLPYFVTVTSDEPRKNIGIFCKISPIFVGKANFVIIGQVDGNRHMNYEPEVYSNLHFTGYLDDARKTALMRHATGVIFPSFSEGFGIPIMEGALFGVPVICSNRPVFYEVTHHMALYFDPNRPDELAMRVNELLESRAAHARSAWLLRDLVLRRFSQQAMRRRFAKGLSDLGLPVRS